MIIHWAEKGKACYPVYAALLFFCDFPAAKRSRVFLALLFLAVSGAGAQNVSPLPEIPGLDSRDTVFRQFSQDVEAARQVLFSSRGGLSDEAVAEFAASLTIYTYAPGKNDELLGLAARCNIPYGTIASINRLAHAGELVPGTVLLLPSIPGIFLPETPENDLERLVSAARTGNNTEGGGLVLSVPRGGKTERFMFFPGDDFSPVERVFFLNRGFQFPLRDFRISSFYGPRINPVTGKSGVHGGLDLAAPEGTEVYATRNGTVAELGTDQTLGNYVIISHDNNWVSLYGHLSSISVTLREKLQSGNVIGRVGSTGQSTGPHLHFELRQNGRSHDPARLLGIFKGGQ